MAKRSGQPALYEIMRSPRLSGPLSGPAPVHEPPAEVAGHDDDSRASPFLENMARLLTPGRVIRIHVGYVFLVIAVGMISVIVAYSLGHAQGASVKDQQWREKFGSDTSVGSSGVNDPLLLGADGVGDGSGMLISGRETPSGTSPSPTSSAARPASAWGPIEPKGDPRVRGWNYYVLISATTQTGAMRLAEFCRSNGLETYVLPDKNGRRVVAFPGFQGSPTGPEATAIKERILAVGVKFKRQYKNAGTDLTDAFPSEYDG